MYMSEQQHLDRLDELNRELTELCIKVQKRVGRGYQGLPSFSKVDREQRDLIMAKIISHRHVCAFNDGDNEESLVRVEIVLESERQN